MLTRVKRATSRWYNSYNANQLRKRRTRNMDAGYTLAPYVPVIHSSTDTNEVVSLVTRYDTAPPLHANSNSQLPMYDPSDYYGVINLQGPTQQ